MGERCRRSVGERCRRSFEDRGRRSLGERCCRSLLEGRRPFRIISKAVGKHCLPPPHVANVEMPTWTPPDKRRQSRSLTRRSRRANAASRWPPARWATPGLAPGASYRASGRHLPCCRVSDWLARAGPRLHTCANATSHTGGGASGRAVGFSLSLLFDAGPARWTLSSFVSYYNNKIRTSRQICGTLTLSRVRGDVVARCQDNNARASCVVVLRTVRTWERAVRLRVRAGARRFDSAWKGLM